jgi:F420-non-reducing hydrogenase small subunit
MYWGSGCGGCDISLLEIGDRILELLKVADVVFWPCVADFKYKDVAAYPDEHIDLCFFNGGVRNSEQEEVARLLRKKSRILVAYGACAAGGGIPALANLFDPKQIFDAAYHSNPSIDNPERTEPRTRTAVVQGDLEIPEFYPTVLSLSDIVPVDYLLPGCPPQADRIWETILALTGETPPPAGSAVGCGTKTVCDECPREKRQSKIKEFQRAHCFAPEPGWCLLEQGLLCMGPATRSGCGALCIQAQMRCEGCYGGPPGVSDQGSAMVGAIGTLLDAVTEDHARELVGQIADPVGTLYRFTLSSSHLKTHR